MIYTPSAHVSVLPDNPAHEVYHLEGIHTDIEQSAIYGRVRFACLDEDSPGIVLTSQCDISESAEQNYVLVARIVLMEEYFYYWLSERNKYTDEEIRGEAPIDKRRKKRDKVIHTFADKYLSGRAYAYYFLPGLEDKLGPSLVTFEVTQCVAIRDLRPENKVCVLKSPFREAVPVKYAAYVGRIGTAAYPKGYHAALVDSICRMRDS